MFVYVENTCTQGKRRIIDNTHSARKEMVFHYCGSNSHFLLRSFQTVTNYNIGRRVLMAHDPLMQAHNTTTVFVFGAVSSYLAFAALPSVPAVTLSNNPLSTMRSKLPSRKHVRRASETTNSQPWNRAPMLSTTPLRPPR